MKLQIMKFLSHRELMFLVLLMLPVMIFSQNSRQEINQTDSQGRKHGLWIKKDRRDDLVYKGHFEHGMPVDTFTYFYEKDKIKARLIHLDSVKVNATLFFKNGNKKAEGIYRNQQRDSLWTFYDKKGKIVSKKDYKDGKLEGETEHYYDSGQLLKKTNYENGKKQGKEIFYYRDNTKEKTQNYQQGVLEGDFMVFYPDGDTMTKGAYKKELRHGTWKYFNEKGKVIELRRYKEGELIEKKEFTENKDE